MTTAETVRYAVELTKRGYSCYPVTIELDSNGSKVPHFKWTPESPGWKRGAYPTDPDEIAEHWAGYDGIAINTERSRLVVVDIDVKEGGVNGHQGLEDAQIVLPTSALAVESWSGGEHRYYRAGDVPVPTSAGALARGVDVRAVGGVIFAPPTPVGDRVYRVSTPTVPEVRDLTEFPAALASRLAHETKVRPPAGPVLRRDLVEHEHGFHDRRRRVALDAIAAADDGERRAAIMRHGIVVFSVSDLMSEETEDAVEAIREAYEQSGGFEWDKHDRLIRDQIDYVAENPYALAPVPATEQLPEGVREDQREDYVLVKDRKMLQKIADREIRQEELEREASRLSLGAPKNLAQIIADPPTTPLWLVDDLLHAEKIRGLVIGQAKAGKSTFVHNLLGSLTSGTSFLGNYPVRRAVRVAYVDLELGERLAYDWLAPLPGVRHENVEYYDRVGQGLKLDTRAHGLRRRWAQELADLGVDVLIIDPVSPVISALGLSEDSSEVRGLLDSFDELANMAGMAGVIVCHHAGHSNPTRGRGSSAFQDWHTARMSLQLDGDRVDLPRTFSVSGRGVAPMNGGRLVRDMETGSLSLDFSGPSAMPDPFVDHQGTPLTLSEACALTGLGESTTRKRLREFGWSSSDTRGGRGRVTTFDYTDGAALDPFGAAA